MMIKLFQTITLILMVVFLCLDVRAQDSCVGLFQQSQAELSEEVREGLYKLAEDQVRTQKLPTSESKNMILREIKRQVFEKASEFESPEVVFSFYRHVIAELSSKDKQKRSMKDINEENQKNRERKKLLEDQKKLSIFPHRKMQTVRVDKGRFNRPRDDNKIERAKITKDFEVVNTHVTQAQYELLMKINPSFHTNEDGTTKYDHPVEQVSRIDAQEYIDKLNVLSKNDDPLIYILIADHRKNSRYDLLTKLQWEYVATRLRTEDGDTVENMIKTNLKKLREYAVFHGDKTTSEEFTQEVGTKKALYLDGNLTKPIYDWCGNVSSWMRDGIDLKDREEMARKYYAIGGSWSSNMQSLPSIHEHYIYEDWDFTSHIGFRLLRTSP